MSTHLYEAPPAPLDPAELERWNTGRLRRRLLTGRWRIDLEDRLRAHFGPVRRSVMGRASLARNVFRKLCSDLAVNYDRSPRARHVDGELALMFGEGGVIDRVGLWPMMRAFQVDLIGLRENWLRFDWSEDLGRPTARAVTPDCQRAKAHPADPNVPIMVRELRWLNIPSVGDRWVWDELSIEDPSYPRHRIIEARLDDTDGDDYSGAFDWARSGDAYLWRWTQGERAGEPFIPGTLYHARRRGLWDALEGIEVVEGTLDVAAAYTFLQHVIFRASWPQRHAANAFVPGAAPRDGGGGPRVEAPADPTSILFFEAINPSQPMAIGQFPLGVDPESLARTVAMLERSVAEFDGLGLSMAHLLRSSSNPWSAAALAITQDDKRKAQRRYTPELRPSDIETMEKLAAVVNLWAGGPALPESGYRIDYVAIPLSREESSEAREKNGQLIASGRMSVVDAYQDEHPGTTREEAIAALERIAEDNKRFGIQPGTAPTPVTAGGAGTAPTE